MKDVDDDIYESILITPEEAGQRLDKILSSRYKDLKSRTYFQTLIQQGEVLVNGDPVKKRTQPAEGDEVQIHFILPPDIDLTPEAIPLNILYEDTDIIVINKPAGMVVHPAPGNWNGTLVNALLHHCGEVAPPQKSLRPGIVHRLDKDTSGVLVAAKTLSAHQRLIEMFSNREVEKEYRAICVGNPGEREIIAPIGRHPVRRQEMTVYTEGGKEAITQVRTLASDGKLSYIFLNLLTGRTHQIRVHLKHLGTPVLGDSVYGNKTLNTKLGVERQLLHAHTLRFAHPISEEPMEFIAPLPDDMQAMVKRIER